MTLPSTEPQVATPIDAATAPLTVRDVMTIDVINIPRTMPVAAIARTLSERSMSGVPVTDEDGMLVGIVTEVDLIRCLFNDKTADHGFIAKLLGNHDWRRRSTPSTRTHQSPTLPQSWPNRISDACRLCAAVVWLASSVA